MESRGPEHLSSVSHRATHLLSDFGQAVLSRLTFPCLSYLASFEGHGKCKYANTHVTCSLLQCGVAMERRHHPGAMSGTAGEPCVHLGCSGCLRVYGWSCPAPRSHEGSACIPCLKCILRQLGVFLDFSFGGCGVAGFFGTVTVSALYSVSHTLVKVGEKC